MSDPHRPLVAVLDYGIGNLRSAQKALERVGADARLTADPALIADAAAVVLPGVGAFGACMEALERAELVGPALAAIESGRPFLGICVGCQLLFDASEESPGVAGLGVIRGVVRWLPDTVKRPQMQWNTLEVQRPAPFLAGLPEPAWMYFVHSLYPVPDDPSTVAATCEYGVTVNAAFWAGSVQATQFHPEKSGAHGLALLANVVRQAAEV